MKVEIDGKEFIENTTPTDEGKDESGNQNCSGCQNCHNSTWCDNSTWCHNSTGCHNSTWCDNSTWCHNSTGCHNSTWCHNSTGCHNSAYCLYCDGLVLEKFMVFNKHLSGKRVFEEIMAKIRSQLGYWKHPKQLTKNDIAWLKKNIKQFDQKVLNKIIEKSELPEKPKETE